VNLDGGGSASMWLFGQTVFPFFPRRVLITPEDLLLLAAIVFGISLLGSGLGVWKALRVRAGEVLS
jgi:putative ABC transport system permease protein